MEAGSVKQYLKGARGIYHDGMTFHRYKEGTCGEEPRDWGSFSHAHPSSSAACGTADTCRKLGHAGGGYEDIYVVFILNVW